MAQWGIQLWKNQKQGISLLACFDLILKRSISWDFWNSSFLLRLSLIIFFSFFNPSNGVLFWCCGSCICELTGRWIYGFLLPFLLCFIGNKSTFCFMLPGSWILWYKNPSTPFFSPPQSSNPSRTWRNFPLQLCKNSWHLRGHPQIFWREQPGVYRNLSPLFSPKAFQWI